MRYSSRHFVIKIMTFICYPVVAAVVAVPDSFYLVISILKCMIRYCKYVTQYQPLQPVRRSVITATRKKTTFSCTQVCTCGSEWVSTLRNRDKLHYNGIGIC